ncbi:MAG: glycoside hydrolase family 2 protein [Actinomycetales bacterium]
MNRRDLSDGWVLALGGPRAADTPASLVGKRYSATVPGSVHTDLMAAGVIPDAVVTDHEATTAWVGRQDWEYRHELWWRPDGSERQELVFDGLDTAAEIWLGGQRIARTANMHRSHRVDVTRLLHDGSNPLSVRLESAWTYAERMRARLGARPGAYSAPYNMIRKMACSFGWDWGPATVTAGIWQPVRLETWSTARLAGVRPETDIDGDAGRLRVHTTVKPVAAQQVSLAVRVRLSGPDGPAATDLTATTPLDPGRASAEVVTQLTVPAVRRWSPRGHGEQPLYDVQVDLLGTDGEVLDTWCRPVGFRDVSIRTGADAIGTGFAIEANGQPIPVRGVNWVPDDVFPHRVTRARYAERLGQAVEAGVNLVRVWGGGRYESHDFYDLCDRLGLLVWQDFAFACAAYPEEEPFASEVEAEAREVVASLMPHPSLALWNGNNENIWGFHDWGWAGQLGGRTWGERFYRDLLPRVVAELDPHRPYWPGSPFSGWEHHPNDDRYGVSHIWDVWNELDYPAYRDRLPRFAAELGWQAPAAWSTLTDGLGAPPATTGDPALERRQKADDGDRKLARGLARFGIADPDIDDWHFLTQVAQARALTTAVEHLRSHPQRCTGVVWWQLNDCWPAVSWSVVDSAGRRKPSWYAMRRAYAERLLTVQPLGALTAVVVADPRCSWRGSLSLRRVSVSGEVLASADLPVDCAPGQAVRVALPASVASPDRREGELVVAELDGRRALWWFAEDAELELPVAQMSTRVLARAGGYDVEVQAHSLVRDLCLFADRVDPAAEVGEQLVTLLPGETTVLRVELPHHDLRDAGHDSIALTSRPVLRAVNDAQILRARASSPLMPVYADADLTHHLVGADRKGTPA